MDRWHPSATERSNDTTAETLIEALEFIARLAELPWRRWLVIGRGLVVDRAALRVRQDARAQVDGAILDHELALLAWCVRDALETAAWYSARHAGPGTRDTHREFAATHGAAESAALALLTRSYLEPAALGALCAPFAASFIIRR